MLRDPDASELNGGLLGTLRGVLSAAEGSNDRRLPPERELASTLGVSRSALRKALALLEGDGSLWRHVGKGTFAGARPGESELDLAGLAQRTNPAEVMRARIMLEPEIARVAALSATPAQIAEMRTCTARARDAATWRQYEALDGRLHRLIVESTQNNLLIGLLDTLNAVRRAVTWGRLRAEPTRPPRSHHSFAEHEAIVDAIADRDLDGAARLMRAHLQNVERKLLGPLA